MTLAEERRSRRFREPDPLEFRVFLFIVGAAFFALPLFALSRESEAPSWALGVVVLFVILGCCMLLVSVLGSRTRVEKWSDAAGNHEVSIVIFLVALPIAWLIRKFIRGDAT